MCRNSGRTITVAVLLLVLLPFTRSQLEDELADFEFGEDETDHTTPSDSENEVGSDQVSAYHNIMEKEAIVRDVVMNMMKNDASIKRNLGEVLPILKVMTPPQKLALAALVKNQVLAPKDAGLDLEQVNTMFGANHNNATSELLLPISLDIANLFRKARHIDTGDEVVVNATEVPEEAPPEAQELRGGPHYRRRKPPGPFRRNIIERGVPGKQPRPRKTGKPAPSGVKDTNCDQLIYGICLEARDYPLEPILLAIRRNKAAMDHLFAEYRDINSTNSIEGKVDESNNRRVGDDDKGFMCPSMVKYARPKKARSTSGNWKFIVNTADHTQTLRLEKCLKPQDTCSYLTDNFKSRCMQVYNYHRLLTWDKVNGLHMDIFKVPTCCSCHIEGYKASYPPEHHPNSKHHQEIFPGQDLSGDPNIDPNLIVHTSHFDSALSFGEPDYHGASSTNQHYGIARKPSGLPAHLRDHDTGFDYDVPTSRYRKSKPAPNPAAADGIDFDIPARYKKPNPQYSNPKLGFDSVGQFNTPTVELMRTGVYDYPKSKSGLSHYLEAPRPHGGSPFLGQTPSFTRSSGTFKRGVTPTQHYVSTAPVRQKTHSAVTQMPTHRRAPVRPQPQPPAGYDLAGDGSSKHPVHVSYPTSTERHDVGVESAGYMTPDSVRSRESVTKRVNYNYHPIIDFFEPAGGEGDDDGDDGGGQQHVQKRMDTHLDDSGGWRPVTIPNMVISNPRSVT